MAYLAPIRLYIYSGRYAPYNILYNNTMLAPVADAPLARPIYNIQYILL
nr:MAG TPA: hypothetical protein [Caudoviricetes sp.]